MRHKVWLARVAAAAFILSAAQARAQDSGETVALPDLPGLELGFEEARGGSYIREWVPRGETVQAWTRMVTLQRFAGFFANGGTLQSWAGAFTSSLRGGCPAARLEGPAFRGTEVELRVDCPRNPATGRPETFMLRGMAGRRDLHIVQAAMRRAPSPADLVWARGVVAGATYCAPGSAVAACAAGADK